MIVTILFLGDIVGPLGRKAVKEYLSDKSFDLVIANGENATHGKGLSYAHYLELMCYGVDVFTSGNHYYNSKDIFKEGVDYKKQVRPYNLDKKAPGVGTNVFYTKNQVPVRVSNFLGRIYLPIAQSNPFYGLDEVIEQSQERIHLVDFHGEATAEKRIFAEYANGKVSAVIGTHTHVQTNDAKILRNGTFFMTDAGMNGAFESSIGDEIGPALTATVTGIPTRFDVVSTGDYMVNGVVMEIDSEDGKVKSYKVINEIYQDKSL